MDWMEKRHVALAFNVTPQVAFGSLSPQVSSHRPRPMNELTGQRKRWRGGRSVSFVQYPSNPFIITGADNRSMLWESWCIIIQSLLTPSGSLYQQQIHILVSHWGTVLWRVWYFSHEMRWKRAPPHFFHLGGRRCNSRWLWGDLAADFHRIHSLTIHYPVPVLTNLSTRKKISIWQISSPSSDKFTFIRPTSIQSKQKIHHPDNPVLTNLLFYQTQNLGFSFVTDSLIIVYTGCFF